MAGRLPTENQPSEQTVGRPALSIPEASLEGIATLAITIMCSGQNRCGTAATAARVAEEWIRGPVDDVRAFSVLSLATYFLR